MCCFNLSDHSVSVQKHISSLSKLVDDIQESTGSMDWTFGLGAWLGGIGKKLLMGLVFVVTIFTAIFVIIIMTKWMVSKLCNALKTKPSILHTQVYALFDISKGQNSVSVPASILSEPLVQYTEIYHHNEE
ncbi:hypothetical protein FKM82_027849 [Ascaphus truei]